MEIHGKASEVNIGPPSNKQMTLLLLHAEGESEPHAFYLTPDQISYLQFKLAYPTVTTPGLQQHFWRTIG